MYEDNQNCMTISGNDTISTDELFKYLDCPTKETTCLIPDFELSRLPPGTTHTSIASIITILSPTCEHNKISEITSKLIRDFVDQKMHDTFQYRGVITIDELKRAIEYGKELPCLFQFLADYFEIQILVVTASGVTCYYSGEKISIFRKCVILQEVAKNEVAICVRKSDFRKLFGVEDIAILIQSATTPPLKYKIAKEGLIDEIEQINPEIIDSSDIEKESEEFEYDETSLKKLKKDELHKIATKYNIAIVIPKKSGKGQKMRLKADIVNDLINMKV